MNQLDDDHVVHATTDEYAFPVRGPCRRFITDIVTLRAVGGDEKGSLETETVKYARESQGTRTQERLRWREPAAYTKADPSSRQRGHHSKTRP
jgi:hypothetical protein